MKNVAWIALASTLLSGCAGRDFVPTMEADPALVGAEGMALVNGLMRAFEEVPKGELPKTAETRLCEMNLPSFHEEDVYPYRRYAPKGVKPAKVAQFSCLRYKLAPTQAELKQHLDDGFALTDLYCDNYFRRVALSSNGRNFVRNSANDIGAAGAAVAGLAKAGSGVTGGIGTLFGLLDASIRNYDEAFLVAKDLPGLEKAVFKAQGEYKDKVDVSKVSSYSAATSIIIRYATFCSWTGMRGLISEKLQDQPADPGDMAGYIENMMKAAERVRKAAAPPPQPKATPTPQPSPNSETSSVPPP